MSILKWLKMSSEERRRASDLRKKRRTANMEISNLLEKWKLSDESYGKVQQLIDDGGDINIENSKERTLLHLAAHFNCPQIASLLIDNGAEIDHASNWRSKGKTPLMQAAIFGHAKVVGILVEAGADTTRTMTFADDCFFPDSRGKSVSALDLAIQNSHQDVVAILKAYKK